jgi:hypothetical protein
MADQCWPCAANKHCGQCPCCSKKKTLVLAGLSLIAVGLLAGCGTHASGKDPVGANIQQGTNAHTIQMPYGFRNVTFECFGPNGVYVTSAGADDSLPSSVYVVANDPMCGER